MEFFAVQIFLRILTCLRHYLDSQRSITKYVDWYSSYLLDDKSSTEWQTHYSTPHHRLIPWLSFLFDESYRVVRYAILTCIIYWQKIDGYFCRQTNTIRRIPSFRNGGYLSWRQRKNAPTFQYYESIYVLILMSSSISYCSDVKTCDVNWSFYYVSERWKKSNVLSDSVRSFTKIDNIGEYLLGHTDLIHWRAFRRILTSRRRRQNKWSGTFMIQTQHIIWCLLF